MKKIDAIIRPERLDVVKQGLETIECKGITVTNVKGRGEQLGLVESYRGNEYRIDLIPKVKLEIVANDDFVEDIVKVILDNAYTGNIGDGKIFISNITEVIRIRTNEKGVNAL